LPLRYKIILIVAAVLFEISFLLLYVLKDKPIINYTIIYLASSCLFLLFVFLIWKINLPAKYFTALLIFGLIIRLSFIHVKPIGSDDIYRYIWDGKVQTAGINPYLYLPNDLKLQNLHSDIIPKLVNYPDMKTIYFPLSQWLFFAGYTISHESFWGYKLLLLLFELLTIYALFLITKKLNIPVKNILLYVLCPLPIIQFAIDSHLDGFGLPLLLFSLYFYLGNKKTISLFFLGLSFSIKPVGLVLIPIMFFIDKSWKEKIKIVLIPLIAFAIQFLPYIFTSNPFEMLFIYARNWTFNGFVFNIVNYFINNNQTARIVCGLMLFIFLLPIFFNKMDLIKKFYYSILLLMIFSPVVHPWYIAWLVIFLPITFQLSGIIYAALSSLTVFTVLNYQLNAVWEEYPLVLILEYLPLAVILYYELKKNKYFNFVRS